MFRYLCHRRMPYMEMFKFKEVWIQDPQDVRIFKSVSIQVKYITLEYVIYATNNIETKAQFQDKTIVNKKIIKRQ